ncbi:MAG: DUF4407 domain-containing protein [Bacteroidales bacterium]|nr:DUF4407 domain-containing protein [Bacteroidales bacterium]
MKKNSTNSYSGLQYFLWLLAGSEISVLSKCPNDYNRHANIGLMILMTSIFASFTGFIAGFTFSHSILGAMLFAVIWGALIFSLDRSMVNSIKKDPTQAEKSMMQYFWPRFFLAVILSFFMSIPLDHIVFKSRIEYQLEKNNINDLKERSSYLNNKYKTKEDSIEASKALNSAEEIENELKSDCPLPEYKTKISEYNTCKSQLTKIKPRIYYTNNDNELVSRTNPAYTKKKNECGRLKVEASQIESQWRTQKQQEAQSEKMRGLSIKTKKKINDSIISVKTDSLETGLNLMKGSFDTQFVTLFLMPNFGVQFLKWLIFLALLVIEILPTYLKLKTPIGQYDWMMYKQERETELETRSRLNALETELNDIEEYRKNKEIGMNKKIIDKVVDIEEKLANEMLEEWESKAREEMMGNVSKS